MNRKDMKHERQVYKICLVVLLVFGIAGLHL